MVPSRSRRAGRPTPVRPPGRGVIRSIATSRRGTPPNRSVSRGLRIHPPWWRALGQPPRRSAACVAELRLQIALIEAALGGANCQAEAVLADLQRGRARSPADDHGLLLLAHALNGQGTEAEECARRIVLGTGALASGHLEGVLDAWAYEGCPEDVERAYREFVPFLRSSDHAEARVALLRSLGLAGDPARARRWYARFADQSAEVFAALVAAHSQPEERARLRHLWITAHPRWRKDREVAEAFVHSFASAGDPEAAECHLAHTLALVDDLDASDAMCLAVAGSYLRAGRAADARRVMEMGEPGFVTPINGRLV